MNFAIEIVGLGAIVPAVVSFAMFFLCGRLFPSAAKRYAAAVAVAAAYVVGYVLLPSWAELIPQRHWHWLPCLAVVAMILGPLSLADGVAKTERWLLNLVLAAIAAWFLVPTWESLQPPRLTYIPLLGGYLFLLMTFLEPIANRVNGRLFCALLCAVALVVSGLVTVSVSFRYGRLAGVVAASLVGCFAAFCFFHKDRVAIRGLVPVFAILVGGCAFIGFVEPERPLSGLLLAPAAPLALWICMWGPLSRLTGAKAILIQSVIVIIPLAIAMIWIVTK